MQDYVFNSQCVVPPYTHLDQAKTHIIELLRALAELDAAEEVLPTLRMDSDPWILPLLTSDGRERSLGEVVHELYCTDDHDVASYFDALNRAIPSDSGFDGSVIDAILRLEVTGPAPNEESCFASVQRAQLHAFICAVTNSVLTSLPRDSTWDYDRMAFVSYGETFSFDHVAQIAHAISIQERRIAGVRASLDPRSFASLRDRAFPNLQFGSDVDTQVSRFNAILLPLLFKRLAELDNKVVIWRSRSCACYPDGSPEVARESLATMQKYSEARRFRDSDGQMRTFEEHVWIDRTHRIHLFRDMNARRIEIGYVGPHLPTITDPT
ncbi:MAG: hypothetical protein FD139_2151 [Methylocystaceae bacterium]|nr:MAG: hypothetical protein FD172_309 [Methylocystaceae bacterium]TXT44541.1 MAG: hypothetical protein FD139_2151 [Methylocystaceae bacterium]